MCSPCSTVSSPVLTTAVISSAGTTSTIPRRRRAAPTPPARAAITVARRGAAGQGKPSAQDSGVPCVAPTWAEVCKAPCVPPERTAAADRGRLVGGLRRHPAARPADRRRRLLRRCPCRSGRRADVEVSAFAVSWRRRQGIAAWFRPACPTSSGPCRPVRCTRPGPVRPCRRSNGSSGAATWCTAPNFVVPPTARAARVVTVHDLTVVLYPELCDPPTLAFPALVRRAVAEGAWVHTPSQFVAERGGGRVRGRPRTGPGRPPRDPRWRRRGPSRPGAPFSLARRVPPLRAGHRHHRAPQGLPPAGVGLRLGGRRPPRRGPGRRGARRLGGRALPRRRRAPRRPGTGSCARVPRRRRPG